MCNLDRDWKGGGCFGGVVELLVVLVVGVGWVVDLGKLGNSVWVLLDVLCGLLVVGLVKMGGGLGFDVVKGLMV